MFAAQNTATNRSFPMTENTDTSPESAATPELSIVIPCYNEIVRLPRTMEDVMVWVDQCGVSAEVVIVDDGSKDETPAWAEEYAKKDPRVRAVPYQPNRGKGYAVRTGMLEAKGQYRIFMDADGSTPVEHTAEFLDAVKNGGADVVIGSRKEIGAQLESTQSLPRRLASRLFGFLTRLLVVYGIKDTQCGFKMFSAQASEAIFPHSTVDGAIFDIELMYLSAKNNLVVREVPVTWTHDDDSRLTYNLIKSLMIFVELVKVKLRHGIILPKKISRLKA